MVKQAGETTLDFENDPLEDVKRRYEREIRQALLDVWGQYKGDAIEFLEGHEDVRGQIKAAPDDVRDAEFWDDLEQDLKQILLPGFEEMMTDSAADAVENLPANIGINLDELNAEVADWARDHVGDLITEINDTTKDAVRSKVANWIESGDDLPALVDRMGQVFDSEYRAQRIAVTEATNAFAEARELTWGRSRVIEKRRWQTAADDRVCPICKPLHGVVRTLGKGFPGGVDNPAAHPNCRCWIAPVLEG